MNYVLHISIVLVSFSQLAFYKETEDLLMKSFLWFSYVLLFDTKLSFSPLRLQNNTMLKNINLNYKEYLFPFKDLLKSEEGLKPFKPFFVSVTV